jgi:tetratricopeptide (TPR) repeat protein
MLISASINADGITSIAKTNKLISKAESAMKSRDFKTAIESYEKALAETPDLPGQIYMNLGNAYLQEKNEKKAQKNYLTAAANIPSSSLKSIAFQQVGNIFFGNKNYKEAMDWYKKSLKTNPTNSNARFNYELAYKLNKQKEEEENKKNPEKNQSPEKDKQNSRDEKKPKSGESKEQQQQPKSEEKKPGQEEKQKGPQPGSKQPENKPGQQQPG